jgi:hypothetical protein
VTEFRVTFVIEKRRIQLDLRQFSVVYLVTSNWTAGTDYLWDLSGAFGASSSREFALRSRLSFGIQSDFLKSFVLEKRKRRVWLQLGILLGILLGTLLGAPIVTCLLRSLGLFDM